MTQALTVCEMEIDAYGHYWKCPWDAHWTIERNGGRQDVCTPHAEGFPVVDGDDLNEGQDPQQAWQEAFEKAKED